jgi:hypothetical protein
MLNFESYINTKFLKNINNKGNIILPLIVKILKKIKIIRILSSFSLRLASNLKFPFKKSLKRLIVVNLRYQHS